MSVTSQVIRYQHPQRWIWYDFMVIAQDLVDAKAAVMALTALPYQKSWVEALQQLQLKREIAGTSRIEGADFSDSELDTALKPTLTAASQCSIEDLPLDCGSSTRPTDWCRPDSRGPSENSSRL